jgi:uncharacterized protein with HEPN domain
MKTDTLIGYLGVMDHAAGNVQNFTSNMTEQQFAGDNRTQMAVMMALVFIGEAVEKIETHYPSFPVEHPELDWLQLKSLRSLVSNEGSRADLQGLWYTVTVSIPNMRSHLDQIRNWHAQGE